jgi:hypothetical protein
MASFDKLGVWPVGYFRAYSSWLLRTRKEVSARIAMINTEIERIGFVTVYYADAEQTVDGQRKKTEVRTGISVTPNSNLCRLLQAYIANGGNPLDISPFSYPDSVQVLETDAEGNPTSVIERYPHAGVMAPMSANPTDPIQGPGESGYSAYPGGFIRGDRYFPARQGGRMSPGSFPRDSVVQTMQQIRGWANQEIKERLQDIEWRIVKQCDLREQLVKERDEVLVQAFGGVLAGVGSLDEERFDPTLRVQNLVQDMYALLYPMDGDTVQSFSPEEANAFLVFTFPDLPSEYRDPLGC